MGPEIGKIYSALWQEVAWINRKWAHYLELFGTSAERIALMNRVAPSFFRTVQDSLLEDVLLHLSRLTDPPKSAGRTNLSIRRLSQAVQSTPIAAEIEARSTAALSACEFARDWRNRRLAHHDFELALSLDAEPLAPASRKSIAGAIECLSVLLNAVSTFYLNSTTLFESRAGDADAANLLYVVRDGLLYDAERLAQVKRGELPASALRADPL